MVLLTHQGNREVPMYSEESLASHLKEEIVQDPCEHELEVFSPEVEAMITQRDAAGALKKSLESLTVPVERTIKARVKVSKAEEGARDALQAAFDKALEVLDAELADVARLAAVVD